MESKKSKLHKRTKRLLFFGKLTTLFIGLLGVVLGILSGMATPEKAPEWLKPILQPVVAAPWYWLAGFLIPFLFLLWLDQHLQRQADEAQHEEAPAPTPITSVGRDAIGNVTASGKAHIEQTFIFGGTATAPAPTLTTPLAPLPRVEDARPLAPAAVSYFIGRKNDLARLRALLSTPRAFVCILNAPGIGKTQLALKAAEELQDLFFEGIYFLDLGSRNATSPAAITDTLREVLAISEPQPFEKLLARVREKRCLFILDNLETALWPPADADATRKILRHWVSLLHNGQALLATSRAPAQAGEQSVEVLPLSADESLEMWQSLRRDGAPIKQGHAELHELLALADGYPLVIYLLSQRAQDLPLPALLSDFRRRKIAAAKIGEGKEASVEASIGLSYAALPAPEKLPARRLFHVLGLLPGGATAATLHALCGDTWPQAWEAVRHVGLGLLRDDRFFALPPLREFAITRATDEEREQLCDFYLRAAKEMNARYLRTEEGEAARQWLQSELPNLHHLWDVQANFGQKRWVIDLADELAHIYQDGVRAGVWRLQFAEKLAREIGARLGEANCIKSRGDVHAMLDENREARACYERAEPIYREIGDRLGEANCRRFIALLEQQQNNHEQASEKFAQALSIAEAIGDRFTQAFVNMEWADSLIAFKKLDQAKQRLTRATELFEAIGRSDRAQQCREKLSQLG